MEPGRGAEEQASRRARRAAQLRREQDAAAATSADVAQALASAERQVRNWSAGAEGERMVAKTMGLLGQYGWTALHDVRWPDRPLANIDHIAIGPGGVVVIDAKNWTGDVRVTDGVLRQNGYTRTREVEGVARATADVTALLAPQHRTAATGLVCLAGQDQPATEVGHGVRAVGRLQLASYLVAQPARLTPYDVADIARHLHEQLESPPSPRPRPPRSPRAQRPPHTQAPRSPRRPSRSAPRRGRGCVGAMVYVGAVGLSLLLFLTFVSNVLARMAAS